MKMRTKLTIALVVALTAVLLLVSCGGNEDNKTTPKDNTKDNTSVTTKGDDVKDTTTKGGDAQGTTTGTVNPGGENKDEGPDAAPFTVTFVDLDGKVLRTSPVSKWGGRATPPSPSKVPEITGKKFVGWSENITDVRGNWTVYPVYEDLQLFTLTFKDEAGNVLKTFDVYEGKGIKDSDLPSAPKVAGKYFSAWTRTVGESTWKNMQDNAEFTATYKDVTAVAPFIEGEIKIDAEKDSLYTTEKGNNIIKLENDGKGTYAVFRNKNKEHKNYVGDGKTPAPDTDNSVTMSVVWDGNFIYFFAEVYDKTLGGRSDAYIQGEKNAYLNDTLELWYQFKQNYTSEQSRMKVGIDAMGIRKFGVPNSGTDAKNIDSMSAWFEDIKMSVAIELKSGGYVHTKYNAEGKWVRTDTNAVITQADLGTHYNVEFAIPAKTEPTEGNGTDVDYTGQEALQPLDIIRVCIQSNDMQAWSAEDSKGEPIDKSFVYADHFSATARTQYDYPLYDSISLGAK